MQSGHIKDKQIRPRGQKLTQRLGDGTFVFELGSESKQLYPAREEVAGKFPAFSL